MVTKRTTRVLGLIASAFLALVILACGSSGEETTTPAASEGTRSGDPFGLVEAINRDIAAAAEETGRHVDQANQAMAEGAEQMGERVEDGEAVMQEAGEQIQGAANEALPPPQ